jgi:signal peptidase I
MSPCGTLLADAMTQMGSTGGGRGKLAGAPLTDATLGSRWQSIAQNARTIGLAVLIAVVIRVCVFEPFQIDGPSMEPSLLHGERLVVAKYPFGLFLPFRESADLNWGGPKLGDVVVLRSPADGVAIIKRVIGLAGDTVEVRHDVVYRNGGALPRRDAGQCGTGSGSAYPSCRWYESAVGGRSFLTSSAHRSPDAPALQVPDAHVYVLGDHRDMSNDSRNPAIGPVALTRIKGKAAAIYWSRGDHGMRWPRMFQALR